MSGIGRAEEAPAAVAVLEAGVVAGGDRIGPVRGEAATEELVELDVLVAGLARVRRRAVEVGVDEGVDHPRAELALDVEDEERDAEDLGDAAGVVGGIRRAARAAELVALRQVGVGAHPDADDLVVRGCLAGEERGGNRRVHPAAHGGNDPAHALATISREARNRGSTARKTSSARSTSAAVVSGPVVIRIEPWASSGSMPIASRTWLGSVLPEVQALPVETSTPSRSSAATRSPPSTPSITTLTLFASRSSAWPVRLDAVHRQQPVAQACAQLAKPIRLGRHRGAGEREGRAEPDDAGHVLGPGPSLALLRAAVELRQHVGATPHEQRADALRAAELVRGEADEVRLPGVHVDRRVRGELHGVDVELRRVPAHDLPDLGDRLDRADLVVRGHHADERRALGERIGHGERVDAAGSVHGEDGHVEVAALEDRDAVQDGLVLDGGRDDVAPARARGPGDALDREVVGLGPAAGEDDLPRLRVDGAGDDLAGLVDALARPPAAPVQARRVAPVLTQIRQHGLEHLGAQRARRGVVEVDRHLRPMIAAR